MLTRSPLPLSCEALPEWGDRAGELLRVLSYVAEPLRTKGTDIRIDPLVQDRLGRVILEAFTTIELRLAASSSASEQMTRSAVFLARLLQFSLGFAGGTWSTNCTDIHEGLSCVLSRLLLVSWRHLTPF